MSLVNLLWIFFIIAAIQPIIYQKILESTRQRLIGRIEQQRGSKVILLIHRQETMSLLGFPVFRYIDINDSEEVIKAIILSGDETPLDIILHTPGGLVLPSIQIAYAIKRHKGKVTVFVPHYAMSGGTLLALASDEIVMQEHAVLGPVDPQLGIEPAASIVEVLQQKPYNKIDDATLIKADMAKKAIRQVKATVGCLLKDTYPDEKIEKLTSIFTSGAWTHDYPISYDEAVKMGLNVSDKMPEDIYHLISLYSQPVRRTPSVEYIPTPKSKGHDKIPF